MQSAHHINDEAGAPGTGASIIAKSDFTRKSLLFDACNCGINGPVCLTCQRWVKHYRMVKRRRAESRAAG